MVGYKFAKLQENIYSPIYMDDINIFAKSENELETDKKNKNIQSGYRNGMWCCKMCTTDNEKRKNINNERNKTIRSRKKENA